MDTPAASVRTCLVGALGTLSFRHLRILIIHPTVSSENLIILFEVGHPLKRGVGSMSADGEGGNWLLLQVFPV